MRQLSATVAITANLLLFSSCCVTCFAGPEGISSKSRTVAEKQPPAGKAEVLVIEQHGSVTGAQLVYIAPNAVRFDCPKKGAIVISKGPTWKVCSYSLETKKWFETPMAHYNSPFGPALTALGIELTSYRMTKVGGGRIYGRDCTIYKPLLPTSSASKVSNIQGIWIADDVKTAYQVGDLMERELGLPPMHKPLIKFDYMQDNHTVHALTTTFCHPRLVSADWFDLPPGLVRAKSTIDVYPGDSLRQFLP